ncbi:MAG: lysophospholipid acyltransferase family protein [Candidatus Omnitrophica bacterium]|nr:lysophospholipid acyltransferase family protein [Candidatus Omnitrophota bacterium]
MFKFIFYKIGQFFVNLLSIKGAYHFVMFVSDLQYRFSPRDRLAVKNNLKIITQSDDNIDFLARDVFRNMGKYLIEFFRMANEIDEEFVRDRVKIVNKESIDKALARKKGIIIATAHIGNWELGAVLISMLGYPTNAIALPHKERPVNELFNKQRESKGVKVIAIKRSLRASLRALQNNECVGVVADRDFTSTGFEMDFLGKNTLIPKGTAVLSAKTGAAIIPTFLLRDKEDSFRLVFDDPIYPPRIVEGSLDDDELLKDIIQKYISSIEKMIRKYPSQWMMFRQFWISSSSC